MSLLDTPAPSPAAVSSFVVLVVTTVIAFSAAVGVADRAATEANGGTLSGLSKRALRTAALLSLWLAATWVAAASGVLGRFDTMPPPFLPFIGLTTLATFALAFSRTGTLLAQHLPLWILVGSQAFRLPLELILHRLALDGVLPVQMTFDGMNYDIVTGILSLAVGLWAAIGAPPRAVVLAWNVIGLFLLIVIVTIAMVSAPVPFRVFRNEPANTIVTTTPFVWLPAVLVQFAWLGHILTFRRLRYEKVRARARG